MGRSRVESTSTVLTGIYLNFVAGHFPSVLLLTVDIENFVHGKKPTKSPLYRLTRVSQPSTQTTLLLRSQGKPRCFVRPGRRCLLPRIAGGVHAVMRGAEQSDTARFHDGTMSWIRAGPGKWLWMNKIG